MVQGQGLELRVQSVRYRAWCSGFRLKMRGLGFRVWGSELKIRGSWFWGLELRFVGAFVRLGQRGGPCRSGQVGVPSPCALQHTRKP